MATFKHGSSPLARGLPGQGVGAGLPRRIIPARAGFTRRRSSRSRGPTDHPRSRGVYFVAPSVQYVAHGSSPLARGLLVVFGALTLLGRIIPARAGFTLRACGACRLWPDHPRSRGVYDAVNRCRVDYSGSSPLARGLRTAPRWLPSISGIIPARAGFTRRHLGINLAYEDHPRSRGVYSDQTAASGRGRGSSPLARGLHRPAGREGHPVRIIPARAGFTWPTSCCAPSPTDHPRSRGVYRPRLRDRGVGRRIIPARAGFTVIATSYRRRCEDHPRSRGVYLAPRVRARRLGRIIPARAGFTPTTRTRTSRPGDHPRSRGVYPPTPWKETHHDGSSPLARGLRRRSPAPPRAGRIIPARAGFTPTSSGAQKASPDHPRSRGVYTCGSLESQRRGTLPDCVCLHCRPSARSAEFR